MLNSHQARWTLFFNRFDFVLSYRPGSQNTKPDALSHLFNPEPTAKEPESILQLNHVVGAMTWQIESEVKRANGENPTPSGCPVNRLFVPVNMCQQVIDWAHCSPAIRESKELCMPFPRGFGGPPWSEKFGTTWRHAPSVPATSHSLFPLVPGLRSL